MKQTAGIISLLLAAAPLLADLAPPNHKTYKHEYELLNLEKFPDYLFYVGSERQLWKQLRSGEAFSFDWSSYMDYDRRFYAIPRNVAEEWRDYAAREQIPPGTVSLRHPPFQGRNTNPVDDPAVRVVTSYNVEVYPAVILLHRVDEKRYDKDNNELPPYSGAFDPLSGARVSNIRWVGVGMSAAAALLGLLFVGWWRWRSVGQGS
jgi:hypothetical protein